MTHGEKKETRPASTATGTASTIDPSPVTWANQSPIGGGPFGSLGGDLVDDVLQRHRAGDLAEDERGDPALAVEHDGAGQRVGAEPVAEGEEDRAALVGEGAEPDVVVLAEGSGGGLV